MQKIKNYKYRIAFGAIFILIIIICALLNGATNGNGNFFIPNMAGVIICAITIFFIWKKFHLGKWQRRSYRLAQKNG